MHKTFCLSLSGIFDLLLLEVFLNVFWYWLLGKFWLDSQIRESGLNNLEGKAGFLINLLVL